VPLAPGSRGDELANFVGYCLAYAAAIYGIEVHASVWMSNHHHTDVTDPHGNLVPFKQLLHSMIARGRNARLGRCDSFWSGDDASDTRRPTDEESLQDLVYTLTNPVKAGLVKWGRLWTGFTTIGWRFGETRTFRRPAWFFDESGKMPAVVSLTLRRPPILRELDDDALYEKLMAKVRAREVEIQQDKAELQRDREWERRYAAARALLRSGKPAEFPAGTYWMRRFAGVAVAEHPP
jgi:putative transposase